MSDLLPLVTAVLRDRASVDALEEINDLKKQLALSRSIEVIHRNEDDPHDDSSPVVVYASAQFQEGEYFGTDFWIVDLQQKAPCRLADLTSCRICVGGGFQVEMINYDVHPTLGPVDGDDGDNSKAVRIYFSPNNMCLTFVIHGWPREDWEAKKAALADGSFDSSDLIEYLVETSVINHPNATVSFKSVSFNTPSVHGALKRLLPPSRREELEAQRVSREEHQAYLMLGFFVDTTMRNRGQVPSRLALFVASKLRDRANLSPVLITKMDDVVDALADLGISELDCNEDVITYLIAQYEDAGHDAMEEIIGQGIEEITRLAVLAAAAQDEGEDAEGNDDLDDDDEDPMDGEDE